MIPSQQTQEDIEIDGVDMIQCPSTVDHEEMRRREELDDEDEEVLEDAPTEPVIKLQKKGTIDIVTLGISSVETWDNLQKILKERFEPGDAELQITTFDGTLIQTAEDYKLHLKPDLHLIIYFPPTIEELSQSLNRLFFENMSNPNYIPPGPPAPMPDPSQLANYLSSPAPTPENPYKSKRYHLQPPTIHFHVPTPTPISITLSNSAFRDIAFYPSEKYMHPGDGSELNSNYTNTEPGPDNPSGDYTIVKADSGLPIKPSGDIDLPPWSPFPLYKSRVGKLPGGRGETSPYRVVSGGLFPVTSFDLYAQSQRRRVLCSISWEVTASPSGKLVDLASEKEISCINWAVRDDERNESGYRKTSERRVYANYEGPTAPENDNKEGQDVGWWMVGPGKLPTGFTGEVGEHAFLLNGVAEVISHLKSFMQRCGIGEKVIQEFTTYWGKNLQIDETLMAIKTHDEFANAFPNCNRKIPPKLVLLKFLSSRDLRNLLPLSITPEPHRIMRIFAVFRVISDEELDEEGIDACGDFEAEVDRVLGGIGSCGGGWDCGHRGFKVAEVGGVRVFGREGKDRKSSD